MFFFNFHSIDLVASAQCCWLPNLWNALFTKFFSREDIPASSLDCQVCMCLCQWHTVFCVETWHTTDSVHHVINTSLRRATTPSYLIECMSTVIIHSCLCQVYTRRKISEVFGVMQVKKGHQYIEKEQTNCLISLVCCSKVVKTKS